MSSKVISFSLSAKDMVWWEDFNKLTKSNGRSELILRVLKEYTYQPGKSEVEAEFDKYCIKNNLSKDAQLGLLLGPYRVWGGQDD